MKDLRYDLLEAKTAGIDVLWRRDRGHVENRPEILE